MKTRHITTLLFASLSAACGGPSGPSDTDTTEAALGACTPVSGTAVKTFDHVDFANGGYVWLGTATLVDGRGRTSTFDLTTFFPFESFDPNGGGIHHLGVNQFDTVSGPIDAFVAVGTARTVWSGDPRAAFPLDIADRGGRLYADVTLNARYQPSVAELEIHGTICD